MRCGGGVGLLQGSIWQTTPATCLSRRLRDRASQLFCAFWFLNSSKRYLNPSASEPFIKSRFEIIYCSTRDVIRLGNPCWFYCNLYAVACKPHVRLRRLNRCLKPPEPLLSLVRYPIPNLFRPLLPKHLKS